MTPTDDTIALVVFLRGKEWLVADEIRHGITRLGFEMPSSQWTAGRLTAMCKESAPRFERRLAFWADLHEYRVTSWAACGLRNNWAGFELSREAERALSTPKPEHLRAARDSGGGSG